MRTPLRRITLLVAVLAFAALPAAAADGTYTMKSGDNLWNVAQSIYGDPMLYKALGTYNSITDYYTIPTGKVIYLPDVKVLQDIKANPAKWRKACVGRLQKGLAEAKLAAAKAEGIGHERFATEAEVIRSFTKALLALYRGFAARQEETGNARDCFAAAQQEFERLEKVWPVLQQLNPGTEPEGPMPEIRRDLVGVLAAFEKAR